MWYVGSRTAKGCHSNDGYICSSKTIKPMILANPEEWEREIVATGTPDEMYQLESEILQTFDAKNDPMSFNQHNNNGKFNTAGKKQSPETCEKLRQVNLGKKRGPNSPESNEKRRQSMLGKNTGPASPEHIQKMRQSMLGKNKGPKSPEHIEKLRQAKLGKKQSPEHVEKIRQAKLNKLKE